MKKSCNHATILKVLHVWQGVLIRSCYQIEVMVITTRPPRPHPFCEPCAKRMPMVMLNDRQYWQINLNFAWAISSFSGSKWWPFAKTAGLRTRGGHAQLFFESAIANPQLAGSTYAITIPQLFKEMLFRNCNFFWSLQLEGELHFHNFQLIFGCGIWLIHEKNWEVKNLMLLSL